MAMPLFVMMMTMVLNRHTFANSYAGAKTDLPWPGPSLCLLTTDDSCFFPLLASTWFVCVFVFFSLCRSLCSSNCLSVFLSFSLFLSFYLLYVCLSFCLFDCKILPGNRVVPIDFGRRKFAKTELLPQPRSRYIKKTVISFSISRQYLDYNFTEKKHEQE